MTNPGRSSATDTNWIRLLTDDLPSETKSTLLTRIDSEDPGDTDVQCARVSDQLATKLVDFYIRREKNGKAASQRTASLGSIADALKPHDIPAPEPDASPDAGPEDQAASVSQSDLTEAVRLVYRLTVKRDIADEEIEIWRTNMTNGVTFPQFLHLMYNSEEAKSKRRAPDSNVSPDKSDGEFLQTLYRLILGRGCLFSDLENYRGNLERGEITREELLVNFYAEAQHLEEMNADQATHDGLSCSIMGTADFLTAHKWQQTAKDQKSLSAAIKSLKPKRPFVLKSEPGVRVSAVASLYRGGDFIEQFMDNMTSQTCFDKYVELIIVDANSPENEAAVIDRYLKNHKSIRYERTDTTIGIYEAWNVGVKMSKGRYVTNTNLDDLRREDSFEIQAGALDALPFVDVVYQDFYYSFDPKLSWAEIAAFGYKSNLPIVTASNMLAFNSPHNAPMWRRSLHDELGYFDESFRSAGDYEFWMRCLVAGKQFFKVNEPHVVYYQNPRGLSTRSDTKGVVEAKAISRKYAPLLMQPEFVGTLDTLTDQLPSLPDSERDAIRTGRYNLVQKNLRDLAIRYKQGKM